MLRNTNDANSLFGWYQLVAEARGRLGYSLDENVESYLVLTLDHYATDEDLPRRTFALDFLEALSLDGREGIEKLRCTGDRCLIIAGLFPERAERFNLKSDYFIDLGQQAYHSIAGRSILKYDPRLFDKLCREFITLTHLLLTMRRCS